MLSEARWRAASALHRDVHFYIQCGSQDVKRYCEEQGYLEVFTQGRRDVHRAVVRRLHQRRPRRASTDTGEVTISAINRNFPGRSGPGQLYLATPYTVGGVGDLAGYITEWEGSRRGKVACTVALAFADRRTGRAAPVR